MNAEITHKNSFRKVTVWHSLLPHTASGVRGRESKHVLALFLMQHCDFCTLLTCTAEYNIIKEKTEGVYYYACSFQILTKRDSLEVSLGWFLPFLVSSCVLMNQSTKKKKLLNFRSAGLFDIKQSEYILMKYKDKKRLQQI